MTGGIIIETILPAQGHIDSFYLGIHLKGVFAQLPTDTGHLESAKRRRGIKYIVTIDPNCPRAEAIAYL